MDTNSTTNKNNSAPLYQRKIYKHPTNFFVDYLNSSYRKAYRPTKNQLVVMVLLWVVGMLLFFYNELFFQTPETREFFQLGKFLAVIYTATIVSVCISYLVNASRGK
jgi:hypothetical protein